MREALREYWVSPRKLGGVERRVMRSASGIKRLAGHGPREEAFRGGHIISQYCGITLRKSHIWYQERRDSPLEEESQGSDLRRMVERTHCYS